MMAINAPQIDARADDHVVAVSNAGVEPWGSNKISSAVGRYFTLLIVVILAFMPIASGMRGFSDSFGHIMLATCDALVIGAYLASLPFAKHRALTFITIIMIAQSLCFMILAPHFPELSSSYQGFRKSILWLMAFSIGMSLPNRAPDVIVPAIITILLFVCLYGIKQYFLLSDFDHNLLDTQSALLYTNKIDGHIRATSVLSSGFHLGMAGCLLIILALFTYKLRFISRLIISLSAFISVYVSFTRTFLIISVSLFLFRLIGKSFSRVFIAFNVGLFAFIALIFSGNDAVGGAYSTAMSDTRLTGRSLSYEAFFGYLTRQPIGWLIGFGPGTAGSTLEDLYSPTGTPWIEPHNIFTKYIFEFGAPMTIILYLCIIIIAFSNYSRSDRYPTLIAKCSIYLLFLSGLTITSVETWPINIYIGIIIGMLCRSRDRFRNSDINQIVSVSL